MLLIIQGLLSDGDLRGMIGAAIVDAIKPFIGAVGVWIITLIFLYISVTLLLDKKMNNNLPIIKENIDKLLQKIKALIPQKEEKKYIKPTSKPKEPKIVRKRVVRKKRDLSDVLTKVDGEIAEIMFETKDTDTKEGIEEVEKIEEIKEIKSIEEPILDKKISVQEQLFSKTRTSSQEVQNISEDEDIHSMLSTHNQHKKVTKEDVYSSLDKSLDKTKSTDKEIENIVVDIEADSFLDEVVEFNQDLVDDTDELEKQKIAQEIEKEKKKLKDQEMLLQEKAKLEMLKLKVEQERLEQERLKLEQEQKLIEEQKRLIEEQNRIKQEQERTQELKRLAEQERIREQKEQQD